MTPTALAIDIGATKIEAGVVDEEGSIISRHRIATPQTDQADVVVAAILDAVEQAVTAKSDFMRRRCLRISGRSGKCLDSQHSVVSQLPTRDLTAGSTFDAGRF